MVNFVCPRTMVWLQIVLSYRPEDEKHPTVKPDKVVDNLAQAVQLLEATT